MNLWDRKLGLLLIVALTFFACDEEVGELNLNPENNLGIFFAEEPLADNVKQVWGGGSEITSSGRVLAGSYDDPAFGKISSEAYLDLSIFELNGDGIFNSSDSLSDAIENAIFVDAFMQLRINNSYGTFNITEIQKLSLERLPEILPTADNNTTSSQIETLEKLGESSFNINQDSIGFEMPSTGVSSADSVNYDYSTQPPTYIYKTEFELEQSFKLLLFDTFVNAVKNGNDDINLINELIDDEIRGLAVKSDDQNSAIITYLLTGGESAITILYRFPEDAVGTNRGAFLFFSPRSYNYITPNENELWSNAEFAGIDQINQQITIDSEFAYLQSGTNLFINLDLSELITSEVFENDLIIQKADIVLDNIFQESADFVGLRTPLSFVAQMTSVENINEGIFSDVSNQTPLNDIPLNVLYEEDSNRFLMTVPLYLQSLIDGNNKNDQLIFRIGGAFSDNDVSRFKVRKSDINLQYYYSTTN